MTGTMKKMTITAGFIMALMIALPGVSQAQVTVIGVSPVGVGVVVGPVPVVPPPPVVVMPGPAVPPPPRCAYRRGCKRRPRCRRNRVRRPAPVPADLGIVEELPKWAFGAGIISTSYSDGGMMGSNLFLRYALSDTMEIEGYLGFMTSCTACYQNAERKDSLAGLNLYYFYGGRELTGVAPYLKAGLYSQSSSFEFREYPGDYYALRSSDGTYDQLGLQVGLGFQWKLLDWLGLNVEGLLQTPFAGDETMYGETESGSPVMNDELAQGLPSAELGKVGLGFNVSASIHF